MSHRRSQQEQSARPTRLAWGLTFWIALGCESGALPSQWAPTAGAPLPMERGPWGTASEGTLPSIPEIQGSGHLSPWQGRWVDEVEGIVTGVDSSGFSLQSVAPLEGPTPESSAGFASRALYVYTRDRPGVSVGARARVAGRVTEYRADCSDYAARTASCPHLSETQLVEPSVRVEERLVAQPEPQLLWDRGLVMPSTWLPAGGVAVEGSRPLDPQHVLVDWYEGLERMRVALPALRVVQPTRARGAAVVAPLERIEHERGALRVALRDAEREIGVLRWPIRFLSGAPELQVGDALAAGLSGVLSYRFGRYQIELADVSALEVLERGPAPESSALGGAERDEWTIGTWNVHELHGASPSSRFEAVAAMVVDGLGAPDAVALHELGDDDGPVDDGRSGAAATLQRLRSAIYTRSALDYRVVEVAPPDGADGGRPGENIRTVLLYRADRGLEYGFARRTESISLPHAVAESTRATRFGEQHPAFTSSRKPLLVPFSFRGYDVWVVAVHLRSKLGDDPVLGRVNPPQLHSASQRLAQARALGELVQQLQGGPLSAPIVVVGDVNDEEASPAVGALEEAGLLCLSHWLPFADRYGYIYDGRAMMLDHALATPQLAEQLSGIDVVHGCAEFPGCVSDHDPLLVRFRHSM